MFRFPRGVFGVLGLLMLVLAGCSSTSSTTSPSSPSSSSTQASSVPSASGPQIVISNFKFSPDPFTVHAGQKVTVVNKDSVAHTLTAGTGNAFDTGTIAPGGTATFTAPATAGSYPYICSIHTFMHGTLTVQ